ncbi:MAG: triose-phosphate isomerase [Deltaproteobacteria bacterium]|nr:triose-phosphate isomerase [Deltaproteobacteria bacterium]MBI4223745.1 triose-phosphate isomerase [Deltaproteobacteria bacterium]
MRTKLIVANWKMNATIAEALKFVAALRRHMQGSPDCEVVICPPFTSLYALDEALSGTPYQLGAQNMYWEDAGAYTGEISPRFLSELNVRFVILGHSERRKSFGETDVAINKKVAAALAYEFIPIICVGETEEEHNEGKTLDVVESQVSKILDGQMKSGLETLVWAYEPVWAIGTGKNATPQQAQEVMGTIRKVLAQALDAPTADKMRLLYGGSVSDKNAGAFLKQKDVDGLLVGGASLDAEKFAKIIKSFSSPQ